MWRDCGWVEERVEGLRLVEERVRGLWLGRGTCRGIEAGKRNVAGPRDAWLGGGIVAGGGMCGWGGFILARFRRFQ